MSTIDRFSNYNKSNFSSKAESDQKTNANEAIDNQDPRKSGKKDGELAANAGFGSSGIQVAAVAILIQAALDQMNTYLKQFTINEQFQGAVNASAFSFAVNGAQQQEESDDETAEATAQQGWGSITQGATGIGFTAAGFLHSEFFTETEAYNGAQTNKTTLTSELNELTQPTTATAISTNDPTAQNAAQPDRATSISQIKKALNSNSLIDDSGNLTLDDSAKQLLAESDPADTELSDLKKDVINQIQNKIKSYSDTISTINNTRNTKLNNYTNFGNSVGTLSSGSFSVRAANYQTEAASSKAQATELQALAQVYNTETGGFSQSAQQAIQSLQAVLQYLQGLNSANAFR